MKLHSLQHSSARRGTGAEQNKARVLHPSQDRTARPKDYIFDRAPSHPKSRFVTVSADHAGVPSAAIDEVVSWLGSLRQ